MNSESDHSVEMIETLIKEFLAGIQPEDDSYEASVQALQQLIPPTINDSEHTRRVQILQNSFELLIQKFSPFLDSTCASQMASRPFSLVGYCIVLTLIDWIPI